MKGYYAKPHVWNLVAKVIRTKYSLWFDEDRRQVEEIALAFAQKFEGTDGFDAEKFLGQCLPNNPLSGL